MTFKTPLAVYIVWHPDFIDGQNIANFLYSVLCRDTNKPLVRSLGIPVYFRFKNITDTSAPIDINFDESSYTAIISLITDDFVLDENYKNYHDNILDNCNLKPNKRRVYPVAISKSAYNISKKFSAINFIRANTDSTEDIKSQVVGSILHELCRLLMNMKRATDEKDSLTTAPPVKLFISHSKHDDSKYDAIGFRDFINSQTQLKTFFDANDISYGSNFGNEIKKSAKESALVVFQSDSYSDREWCRIEVLEAKSAGCPIVIVNAVQNREKRAFPYLGNYPSIRFKGNYMEIVDLTLEQALFNLYTKLYLDELTDLYGIKTSMILSNTPELFNFLQLKENKVEHQEKYALVIYPDPPLGTEEMDILNKMDDEFIFITPLTLPSIILKQ